MTMTYGGGVDSDTQHQRAARNRVEQEAALPAGAIPARRIFFYKEFL